MEVRLISAQCLALGCLMLGVGGEGASFAWRNSLYVVSLLDIQGYLNYHIWLIHACSWGALGPYKKGSKKGCSRVMAGALQCNFSGGHQSNCDMFTHTLEFNDSLRKYYPPDLGSRTWHQTQNTTSYASCWLHELPGGCLHVPPHILFRWLFSRLWLTLKLLAFT